MLSWLTLFYAFADMLAPSSSFCESLTSKFKPPLFDLEFPTKGSRVAIVYFPSSLRTLGRSKEDCPFAFLFKDPPLKSRG